MTAGVQNRTALAARLREETRTVHEEAEQTPLMARLIKGDVDRDDLRGLTRQLVTVYEALEGASRALADEPRFAGVHAPELERLDALRADLAALSAEGEPEVPLLPAATAYAERIRDVADQPARLLAHHYTRYLGDLSGGQALGSIFGRALGLEAGQPGISFYQFQGIEKVKPYKDRYRELLDGAPLSDEESDAAVEEAIVAFRCNQALFEELESLKG